jgi:hypothetical protein
MEEAIEWVKRCPDPMPGEESEIEIRPLLKAEDLGKEFTPELRGQEQRQRAEVERQTKGGSRRRWSQRRQGMELKGRSKI